MIDYFYEVVERYKRSTLLVDTNLLLLLLIGRFDRRRITKDRVTRKYTNDDYDLLELFIEPFPGLLVVPNILTEVSNLSGQLTGSLKSLYFGYLAQEFQQFSEICIPSGTVAQTEAFASLGLTDAAIFALLRQEEHLVLTDDFDLYHYLSRNGFHVFNFNHLRVNLSDD